MKVSQIKIINITAKLLIKIASIIYIENFRYLVRILTKNNLFLLIFEKIFNRF